MEENKNPFGEQAHEKSIAERLAAPFEALGADGKMYPSHKWRVQSFKSGVASCIPYIDARQVVSRLNSVLGIEGWSNNLIEMSGKGLICEIVVSINGNEISKSNVGTETNVEKEKGQASDALKRAAANFEVGAYLYEMQPVILKIVKINGKNYPATENGTALKSGEEITSYINMLNPFRQKLSEIYMSIPEENRPKIDKEFKKIWEVLTT